MTDWPFSINDDQHNSITYGQPDILTPQIYSSTLEMHSQKTLSLTKLTASLGNKVTLHKLVKEHMKT